MELHLKIIGILMIILSLIHIAFPAYFKWKSELATLSLINRQVMYVHTFFIGLVVFFIGLLFLMCTDDLMNSSFGKKITGALFIFWFIRLACQLFVYSPALWKGKRVETIIHIIFTAFWIYTCVVFFLIYSNA